MTARPNINYSQAGGTSSQPVREGAVPVAAPELPQPDSPIDGEEWRVVSRSPNYAVSCFGRVMRITGGRGVRAGRVLRQTIKTTGYPKVELSRDGKAKTCVVHQLVCEAFHGPKPSHSHQVAHRDGDRTNARADNLRWATPAENEADKIEHGTAPRGEKHGGAKYSPKVIFAVREAKGTHQSIGRRFGIPRRYVGYIRSGDRWGHI